MFKPCDKCGEPGIVDGCCYDHSKLCTECNEGPMHYNDIMCSKCYKALVLKKEVCYVCKAKIIAKLKQSASGWYVARCCDCDHPTRISRYYETAYQVARSAV